MATENFIQSTSEIARISEDSAKLKIESKEFDLPVVKATCGPDGILISKLKNEAFVTLDPGFLTTAQCSSNITYIDGEQSILRYRGYPIQDLAEKSTFLEVAYLLIYGYLPTKEQRDSFIDDVNGRTLVGEDFRSFLGGFPRDAHPMALLSSSVAALGTFCSGTSSVHDLQAIEEATKNILAKTRTITSFLHRRRRNEPLLYPDYSRGYVDDFIRMCFAIPYERFESNPLLVDALDKLLILHADHEQNCSTTVVRITGSSNASLYSSVAAGICALSGPLHGGANEKALKQICEIREYIKEGKTIQDFVNMVKDNKQKLAGFGHRVYKSYDPRAAIAKEYAKKMYDAKIGDLDLFELAFELEEVVMEDDYFSSRHLYPNIDLWTGLIYKAMGFDPEMFTTIFALARIPGWIAHWREMHRDPLTKIGRPRQVYTGPVYNKYISVDERKL
ncbi:MAG: citrate synthase [Candidatus Ancillula sp.]|jgi:citrate synthase|nr:citrate synthase [Candidatus Ancillula sp.]